MHIADGFLSAPVAATTAVAAVGGIALAARQVTREKAGQVVGIGMMAAFLFVAQMVNFPCLFGASSGHLLGAGLAVAVLGVAPGMLAVAVVVVVQALFFKDGGISALGANVLNMAVVGPLTAGLVLRAAGRRGVVACFGAAAVGMFVSAGFCMLELGLSGTTPLRAAPLFMGVHALIAVLEGVITAAVVAAMAKYGAGVLAPGEALAMPRTRRVLALLTVGVLLITPLACSWPDGLEYVAERYGFAEKEATPGYAAWTERMWFADYELKGVPAPYGTWAIAVIGGVMAFGVAWVAARGLRKREEAV